MSHVFCISDLRNRDSVDGPFGLRPVEAEPGALVEASRAVVFGQHPQGESSEPGPFRSPYRFSHERAADPCADPRHCHVQRVHLTVGVGGVVVTAGAQDSPAHHSPIVLGDDVLDAGILLEHAPATLRVGLDAESVQIIVGNDPAIYVLQPVTRSVDTAQMSWAAISRVLTPLTRALPGQANPMPMILWSR